MKLLTTITDTSLGLQDVPVEKYKERKAARAVVFDGENKIALLYVSKHDYYKLPGGGIEEGEDVVEALKRECLEEIGSNIDNLKEVGEIIEYRNKHSLKQTSFCYVATLKGLKDKPKFEEGEISEGFKELWVDMEEAMRLLKNSQPNIYNGNFIVKRDTVLLEAVMENI